MEGKSGVTNAIIIFCPLKFIIGVSSSTICPTKMSSPNTLITLNMVIYEIFKGCLFDAGVEKMPPATSQPKGLNEIFASSIS